MNNFNQWKTWFEKSAKAELKNCDEVHQIAAQMLFDNIIKRTPVGNPSTWNPPYWPKGYVPGNLKAGWKIEIIGNDVSIYNEVEYAEYIENGWSGQAPAGMMRISLLEWDKLLEKASRYRK